MGFEDEEVGDMTDLERIIIKICNVTVTNQKGLSQSNPDLLLLNLIGRR